MSDIGRLQQELERRAEAKPPPDLTELRPLEREVMLLLLHHGHMNMDELCDILHVEREDVQSVVDGFVTRGLLLAFGLEGRRHYRPLSARRRATDAPLGIWAAVDELIE